MKKHKLKNKEEMPYLIKEVKEEEMETIPLLKKRRRMADKSKYDKVGKVMGYTVKSKTLL